MARPRMIIKDAVWSSSEDEKLKEAVMKHGEDQWLEICYILRPKTANQCKARWNEMSSCGAILANKIVNLAKRKIEFSHTDQAECVITAQKRHALRAAALGASRALSNTCRQPIEFIDLTAQESGPAYEEEECDPLSNTIKKRKGEVLTPEQHVDERAVKRPKCMEHEPEAATDSVTNNTVIHQKEIIPPASATEEMQQSRKEWIMPPLIPAVEGYVDWLVPKEDYEADVSAAKDAIDVHLQAERNAKYSEELVIICASYQSRMQDLEKQIQQLADKLEAHRVIKECYRLEGKQDDDVIKRMNEALEKEIKDVVTQEEKMRRRYNTYLDVCYQEYIKG